MRGFGFVRIPAASIKLTAALTAFLFAFNSVLPAQSAALVQVSTTAAQTQTLSWLENFEVSESLGRLESLYLPPASEQAAGPVVIHIQDAHTHAEAQLHIEGLLEELQAKGLVSRVAVEGASGTLLPEILKVSAQDQINLVLADYLLNLGELTGAERFALKNNGRLPILGAEDPALYRESYLVFTQVKKLQEKTKFILEAYGRELERLQISILPKEVHEYVMRSSEWHRHQETSFRYIDLLARYSQKYLGLDFSDARLQFDWPSFVRLVALQKMESDINGEAVARELESILAALSAAQSSKGLDKEKIMFVTQKIQSLFSDDEVKGWVQDARYPEIKSVRSLMEALKQLSAQSSLELMAYPQFLRKAGVMILREEVDARLLFSEIERVENALEEKIAVSEKEKEILSLTRDFRVLEKLLSLSVTREEFNFFSGRAASFSPLSFRERMRRVSGNAKKFEDSPFYSDEHLALAVKFYELSRQRDDVLVANAMKDASGKAVVLITGGFHSQGVTDLLRERKIPHVVIAPKMSQPGDETLYEKVMLGTHAKADFNDPAAAALVKTMLSQSPAVYETMHPGSAYEQAALIFLALRNAVLPALRLQQVPERVIYDEISRWISSAGIFNGTNFQITFDAAANLASLSGGTEQRSAVSRSELRMAPEPDTLAWIAQNFPEDSNRQKVVDAITDINQRKETDYAAANAAAEGLSPSDFLLESTAESLPEITGVTRDISRIEGLVQEVSMRFGIKALSLAHRAAFILGAFNQTDFPVIHSALQNAFAAIRFEEHIYSEDLSAEEYARLARKFSEAVSRETVQENVIIRSALTEFVFDLPAPARRALEKENLVNELIRELREPGKGRIPKLVFLTDLHGSTKVGSFIAFALDIENYTGITSPDELERRLIADWQNKNPGIPVKSVAEILEERNVLIVGGSDYVDRGPKPYWGFQFNKWLRDHGLLKFINGNHDLWKDWNVIGLHLHVHDTLRGIAASGKFNEADIEDNLKLIRRYVTTAGWDPEKDKTKFEDTEAQIQAIMKNFMLTMEQGTVNEGVIETFADRIIDSGNNANHSLEWWAREWGIHGGWFDTFLDQINEELVNAAIQAANDAILRDESIQARILTMFKDESLLPEEIRAYVPAWREKVAAGKPMFDRIEATLFSKGDDVKALKAEIERIKKTNAEIRSVNEKLAAEKRFGEMTPQNKVPSAFELTAKAAQAEMARVKGALEILNDLLPGADLPVPESVIVTQQNYRTNSSVVETALWDWKNFRLLYTDVYDNVYVHGIIPVDVEKLDFKVEYTNPEGERFRGIAAIERIQYEVRSFFEKYDTLPDTPEFRAELDAKLGSAFQVLNEWYSDVLGFLKPESIQGFLKSGGAKSYPFGQGSDFSPRQFKGAVGTMHVGHVESAKLKKQKLSYWIGGMEGGLLHGDFEMSEGYSGLGAIVQWFSRDAKGAIRGFSRFGYKESVAFYSNQIKEKEKKLKDASTAVTAAKTAQKTGDELQLLEAAETKIKEEIAALKAKREALITQGERMEDITFHDDLMPADAEKIRPFTRGGDLARYYINRFLSDNVETYRALKEEASGLGSMERAAFFETREKTARERLVSFRKQESERLLDILTGLKSEAAQKILPVRAAVSRQDYAGAEQALSEVPEWQEVSEEFTDALQQFSRAISLFARSELREEFLSGENFIISGLLGSPALSAGLIASVWRNPDFRGVRVQQTQSADLPVLREPRGIDPETITLEEYESLAGDSGGYYADGLLGRSELRATDLDLESFLEQFPNHILEIWRLNSQKNRPTLVAFSGAEADGKSTAARKAAEKIEEIREQNKEAYPLPGNMNVTRVISLDRWFLERHRRNETGDERAKFLNKWAIQSGSDVLYGETPFHVQAAVKALRGGQDAFAPLFLNSIKQRVRVSDPAPYLDPVSQNIRPSKVRQFHEQIKQDLALLAKYKKDDALTLEVGGRQLVRLFTTGHHWNFKEPDNQPEQERMREIEHRIFKSIQSFALETGYRFDQSHFYLDMTTGDVLEKISPAGQILFFEGVVSLLPEVTENAHGSLYDETVWVGAGMPATLEEALQDQSTNIRLWRYVYRRSKEGRMAGVSVPQLVKEFRERQRRELPIIFSQRSLNRYRVNTLTETEKQKIANVEQVVPVIIAFDVGGGKISMAHEIMRRSEDGFSFVFSGKLEDEFSEFTRSREGPEGQGRDKVLSQLAILAIERILKLQADYPGRPIMPVLAIGAPGNTAHPSFGDSIAPRSADNLGTDFDGVVPDVQLRELIRLYSGLNIQIVWKNDSLAQAYAAVSELLPNHSEYRNDTVLFLSLGTGLGMGVVRVNGSGDQFETLGDSHNFDLDFTDQFPVVKHPVYGESFRLMTPGGEVFVPTSERGKVRAEDLVSGRAIRQILSAFERQALDREQQLGVEALKPSERPFFLKAAGQVYQQVNPDRRNRVKFLEDNNIEVPVHKQLVLDGHDAIHPHDRDKLRQIIQHDYTKTPVTGWLLNQLAEKQHTDFVELSDQIEAWREWIAEFLASRTLDVIKRTRSGDMRKTNPVVSWPAEWEQQLRELNIRHVLVGSGVATEGQLAAVFRSKLNNKLQTELAGEGMTLNVIRSMPKAAGVKGARLYVNANDAQKELAIHLTEGTSIYLDPPPFYKETLVDREQQKRLAYERPRAGVLLDLGDALLSKDKPLPEETKRILNTLVNKGIPVGVATGKPIDEVYALFGQDPDNSALRFADKLYIYALNGSVIHAPMKMRKVYPGEINFFDRDTRNFIEDYLFPTLAPYGFGPAFVYPDKNDLTKPSSERRGFEGPGPTGSRINVTAILGDRNPNFHRVTTAAIINHLASTMGFQKTLSADVAGRIGLDLSNTNKGTAEAHFMGWILDLIMPVALERMSEESRRLAISRNAVSPLDRGDILKIFDLYQNGLGMDAQMADPYSYSVGTSDVASLHDVRAPVMIGGGPDETPRILSRTRFVDEAGRIFRVNMDGSVAYETLPASPAVFSPREMTEDQEDEYSYWIQQILAGKIGFNDAGQLVPVTSIAQSWTGWARLPLLSAERMRNAALFAQESGHRFNRVVVIAMGGPGNAASLMLNYYNKMDVILVDHLDPVNLAKVTGDLSRTLFVVSSKSGTTAEIIAMMDYYRQKLTLQGLPPEAHFAVITDKGSPMNVPGSARKIFVNDADKDLVGDIGGRFSIGSYFGYVPAALGKVSIEDVGSSMTDAQRQYKALTDTSSLLGVQIADALVQAREAGRNKVTLVFPPALESFGMWLKQLVNESLGKMNAPIMVISGESYSLDPSVYGKDRIFLRIHFGEQEAFELRNEQGLPVIDVRIPGVDHLGGLVYHMMMAVTLAGFRMGINPFDQPAVEQSKKNTRQLMEDYLKGSGRDLLTNPPEGVAVTPIGNAAVAYPKDQIVLSPELPDFSLENVIAAFLGEVKEKQYVAFLPTTHETESFKRTMTGIRTQVRDRLKTHPATLVGTVSKDNHSNLQLHAAESNQEPAVLLFTFGIDDAVDEPLSRETLAAIGFPEDYPVKMTYAGLNRLIAQGEFKALSDAGKKVLLVHLPERYRTNEGDLANLFEKALLVLESQGKALPARSELRAEENEELYGRWLAATQRTYRAEISDVDGNITPSWGSEVPDEVIQIFRENLQAGIPQGIASVRSEEGADGLRDIETRVLAGLDPQAVSNYLFFSENGTFAHWQSWDSKNGVFIRHKLDIAQLFGKVPEGYVLEDGERKKVYAALEDYLTARFGEKITRYKEAKTYGFLATILRKPEWNDREYSEQVAKAASDTIDFLAQSEDPVLSSYDAMMTRTSIVVMKKDVNKSLAIQYFSARYGISLEEIVGTDDQASREGNGWFLTQHAAGFSTNDGNPKSGTQIPLKEIFGVTGVDAWLKMHEFLNFRAPENPGADAESRSELRSALSEEPFQQGNIRIDTRLEDGKYYFASQPLQPFDLNDAWQVQRYFRDLYDALSDFAATLNLNGRSVQGAEIQLKDEVLKALVQGKLLEEAVGQALSPDRIAGGFVSQLELYRLLSVLRGKRFVPPVPDYQIPASNTPVQTALVVDENRTNLDAVLLREWLGNPDVSLSVIVGTTPAKLFRRLHSSVYGEFPVAQKDIRINEAEKWIEIMGKRVYVAAASQDILAGTRADLVLSVYPLSEDQRQTLAGVFASGGSQTAFVTAQNLDVFAFKPQDKQLFQAQSKLIQSSLLTVPAVVSEALSKTALGQVPHTTGLEYSVSPMPSQPILDRSGVDRSALKNVVAASRPVQEYFREILRSRLGAGLGEVSIESVPVSVGDMLFYRITVLPGDQQRLLSAFGIDPALAADEENFERDLRKAFVERAVRQAEGSGIRVDSFRQPVATDARFEKDIVLGEAGVEVSSSMTAAGPLVQIVVPVLFNRELQDTLLLSNEAASLSKTLKASFVLSEDDVRLSPYGQARDRAFKRQTLPPIPLEIPGKIGKLLEKPVVVGVLGPQGQIGSRLGILGFQSLNYVMAYGSVDSADKVQDAASMSSINGPIRFNGQIVPVTGVNYDESRNGTIGQVQFGEGSPFYILPRFRNPKDIPWGSFGVEVVVDATGAFLKADQLLGHLNAGRTTGDGASAVLLTAPFKDNPDKFPTIVYGVNQEQIREHLEKGKTPIFSNASCTTNCMALMTQYANRLPEAFSRHLQEVYEVSASISEVVLSPSLTVHSPTNSNPLIDGADRSAAGTIFYKSGVTKAIVDLGLSDDPWPGAFTGFAFRVGSASTSISHLPVVFQIENMSESDRLILDTNSKKIGKELLALAEKIALQMSEEQGYQGLFRSVSTTEQWNSEIAAGTRAVIVDWQQAQIRVRPDKQLLGISLNGFYDNVEQYTAQLARTLDELSVDLRENEEKTQGPVPGSAPREQRAEPEGLDAAFAAAMDLGLTLSAQDKSRFTSAEDLARYVDQQVRVNFSSLGLAALKSQADTLIRQGKTIYQGDAGIERALAELNTVQGIEAADFLNHLANLVSDRIREIGDGRSELRELSAGAFEAWQENYQTALPFLGGRYEDRRWVAVHMARGIFAVIPANLAPAIREAARSFVARDLFYFDGEFERPMDALVRAGEINTAQDQPGLEISIASKIENPEAHFLAVANLLAKKPNANIYEILVGSESEEAEKLQRTFADDPSYAAFAGRYRIAAVAKKDLSKALQEAASSVFNQVRGASDAGNLAEFIERHVAFSSPDRELLVSGLTHTGWLIHDDLGRHPGLVAARMDRSVSLAAGQLEPELIRKLGEIKALRKVISAAGSLMSGLNLQLIEDLWNKEMAQRWFYKSA